MPSFRLILEEYQPFDASKKEFLDEDDAVATCQKEFLDEHDVVVACFKESGGLHYPVAACQKEFLYEHDAVVICFKEPEGLYYPVAAFQKEFLGGHDRFVGSFQKAKSWPERLLWVHNERFRGYFPSGGVFRPFGMGSGGSPHSPAGAGPARLSVTTGLREDLGGVRASRLRVRASRPNHRWTNQFV
jgi:hypothetical protein